MVLKFLKNDGAGAFVLPLSLAYHRSEGFRKLRAMMQSDVAKWSFAFFDREPHALFGEDVKTRNALAFRQRKKNKADASIETTRLIRFTSASRQRVLRSLHFTKLENPEIGNGIPKLEGPLQNTAYHLITESVSTESRRMYDSISSATLQDALIERDHQLIVSGTAYSFIGVCPGIPARLAEQRTLSASTVHRLTFRDSVRQFASFALISSRVTFWLWLVSCDGFHVPQWFLRELPLITLIYDERIFNSI